MATLRSPVTLGIKAKFIAILIIAAALPLVIGLATLWGLGYGDFKRERGVLFQSAATHLALGLSETIQSQIEELDELIHDSNLSVQLARENERSAPLTDAELSNRVNEIEARWPSLQESDSELQSVLTNAIALRLSEFRFRHPFFAEIFVTDARGQNVGATDKTSDYWQSDEDWWQKAFALNSGEAHLDGVHFDESARVHSIDISIPIFDHSYPPKKLGVIKGVLNASPLFFSVEPLLSTTDAERQLVLGDGRILISLAGQEKILPLRQSVDPSVAQALAGNPGWIEAGSGDNRRLVAYSPVMTSKSLTAHTQASGLSPLYVVVHDRVSNVMFPVRQQFLMLTVIGTIIVFVFGLIGLFVATKKIIRPIRNLRVAAQTIAASARSDAKGAAQPAGAALRQVARINTGDELEFLAKDFSVMATRILSYQDQLTEEIAVKTAEIQRDLDVAREFQEALMPRTYPQVPSPPDSDSLSLNFHHVYLPTSSVGGDFFDVMKLSDHRAGIFIADVMGHGARSALVTAILRTLLQDLAGKANDPAQFMSLLNRHFHSIIEQSNQFIFVSAFYLLIDTERATASYASAGHPPPFVADRATRKVEPLIEHLEDNPALGLFPDSSYQNFSRPIKSSDVYLLFTDGVFELMNSAGEEFGRDRLRDTIERNLDVPANMLTEKVIDALDEFRGPVAAADDICLVACEIRPGTPRPVSPEQLAQHKG